VARQVSDQIRGPGVRARPVGAHATRNQVIAAQRHIKAAATLLDWLCARDLTPATARQGDLETWLVTISSSPSAASRPRNQAEVAVERDATGTTVLGWPTRQVSLLSFRTVDGDRSPSAGPPEDAVFRRWHPPDILRGLGGQPVEVRSRKTKRAQLPAFGQRGLAVRWGWFTTGRGTGTSVRSPKLMGTAACCALMGIFESACST
jgi:hypothetical protein